MSEHKFTPGPWIVRKVGGQGFPGQVGYAIDFNEDQEQVVDFVYEEADAHLIAAAPDLFESLREVLETPVNARMSADDGVLMISQKSCEMLEAAFEKAKAVIAKALGSQ